MSMSAWYHLVMEMRLVTIQLVLIFVHAILDIAAMDLTAQVNNILFNIWIIYADAVFAFKTRNGK